MKLMAFGFLAALTASAVAQEDPNHPCMNYGDLRKAVAQNFGEAPAGSGIVETGKAVIMIFASPKGDTWTAAILGPDGNACVIAHGSDWEPVIPPEFSMKDRRPA